MGRKFLSVLLTLCMLLSLGIAAYAEEAEFIKNGDFEQVNGQALSSWSATGGKWGEVFSASEDTHGGEYALRINTTESAYAAQTVTGLVPNTEYTLTAWIKVLSESGNDESGPAIKAQFANSSGASQKSDGVIKFYGGNIGKWKKIEYTFTTPEDADRADFLLRVLKGGDVLWDDVSMVGEKASGNLSFTEGVTENAEFVANPSFEDVSGSTAKKWTASGGKWGEAFTLSEDAKDGKTALRISTEKNVYASQMLTGIVPGEEYTLTGSLKVLSDSGNGDESGPAVKMQYYKDGKNATDVPDGAIKFYGGNVGKWKNFEYTFTAPEGVDAAEVLLRVLNGGDVLWDNLSMVGKRLAIIASDTAAETVDETPVELMAAVEGETNLIPGANFETTDANGKITGADTYKNDLSQWITIEESELRGGKVLHIQDEESTNNPWACFVVPVMPGAKYQLSGWLRAVSFGSGGFLGMKVEFYSSDNKGVTDLLIMPKIPSMGAWTQIAQYFTVPLEDITTAKIYFRLYGAGDIYFDDFSLYAVEKAVHFTANTGFFYYRDETTAKTTVRLNTVSYPFEEGGQLNFKVLDGETILREETLAAQKDLVWTFPTYLLKDVEKSYTVRMDYLDKNGASLECQDHEVLIYNRPQNLTKDGIVLDNSGNPLHPVMGYHAWPASYQKAKELGMNVQQCIFQSRDLSAVKDALDEAEKAGVMLLVPLYANMKPAGHPDNQEMNAKCIQEIKDHPALLGYMVMDEPFLHAADAGSDEDMYKWLQDSYKFIRQYDKENLIYICECERDSFGYSGAACDLLSVDPYIGSKVDIRAQHVSGFVREAVDVMEGRKPVWSIVQAWQWIGGGADDYIPSANDIRSFLYQSLFAGAQGLGYYQVDSLEDSSVPSMWDLPLNDGVVCFNEKEWEDAQKAFITGEYPTFAQNTDEASDVWYKLFVKGKDIYAVLLNRKNQESTVSIPLTSLDGSVTIGSFTATADDVSGAAAISGTGVLTATLSESQVVRYKLTVSEDLSGLTTSKFRDIYNYGWAKKAIDTLYQKGIANAKGIARFAPGEQITRGDFAMFLIKTLGLTAEGGDNFADVNPNAEYADAIRIGKKLGILKGTDGVNYLPETQISRQDLMVICARGMRLKKEMEAGDASQFTDAASIADYAVLDIAAMVRANIVKGYEDGTIRPLGNTTRAEAAVIMERIMAWENGL